MIKIEQGDKVRLLNLIIDKAITGKSVDKVARVILPLLKEINGKKKED